jgi:hypothetical protein
MGRTRWWEPLTTKWGILATLIFVGLVINVGDNVSKRFFPADGPASATRPTTPVPLSREEQIKAEADRIYKERYSNQPTGKDLQAAAAQARERKEANENRQAAEKIVERRIVLARFRTAVESEIFENVQNSLKLDRPRYLATSGPVYIPMLNGDGSSLTRNQAGSAPRDLQREASSGDRQRAIDAMVVAFENPNIDNQEIFLGMVRMLQKKAP